jgi:uncharacterized protein (TIGR03545 family)
MSKWIRWWGLGVFVAICLIWWLAIDWAIKNSIETFGTQAMGAKVELNSAELTLSPLSIKLTGLQLTDPDKPMQNLLVATNIEISLDSLLLLRRKFISEQMDISGLQFFTPRTRSGATGKTPLLQRWSQFDLSAALPGISLPDPAALIEQQKAEIQQELDAIEANIDDIKTKWEIKRSELPDSEQIAAYKARIKKLKKENAFKRIKGLNDLRDDINDDLSTIKGLDKELSADISTIKSEINKARQLPAKQTDKILSKAGINTSSEDFTRALMGGKIQQWLQQGLAIIEQASGLTGSGKKEASTPAQGEGLWVSFEEFEPLPEALIKNSHISGVFTIADQDINFDGQITDITHQPQQWHKPLSFSIKGQSDNGTKLQSDGELDHRKKVGKDTISYSLSNLALQNYSLSDNPKLSLLLNKGIANSRGEVSVIDNKINLNTQSDFNTIKLTTSSNEESKTSRIIASALSSVNQFDLMLSAIGDYTQPDVSIKSSLDKILKDALKTQLKSETNNLKGEIEQKLEQQLSGKLSALDKKSASLDGLKDLFANKKAELTEIGK